MKVSKLLLFMTLLPSLVLGQVKYLEKDQPAPYTGYLFTPEAEQKNRFTLIEHEFLKKELVLYKDNNTILELRVKNWQDQSDRLSKELIRKERNGFWQNALYFGLGAVLTGLIAVGVDRAIR